MMANIGTLVAQIKADTSTLAKSQSDFNAFVTGISRSADTIVGISKDIAQSVRQMTDGSVAAAKKIEESNKSLSFSFSSVAKSTGNLTGIITAHKEKIESTFQSMSKMSWAQQKGIANAQAQAAAISKLDAALVKSANPHNNLLRLIEKETLAILEQAYALGNLTTAQIASARASTVEASAKKELIMRRVSEINATRSLEDGLANMKKQAIDAGNKLRSADNACADLGKTLKNTADHSDNAAAKINNFGREVGVAKTSFWTLTANILKSAPAFAVATFAISLVYQAARALRDELVAGFMAVEDYQNSVTKMAAIMTTFSQKAKEGDIGGAWKQSHEYAQKLVKDIEIMDVQSAASAKNITDMVSTLMGYHVQVNTNIKEQREAIVDLSNAIQMLAGNNQNAAYQFVQEIKGMMEGTIKSGSQLVLLLSQSGMNVKAFVKDLQDGKKTLADLLPYLSGFRAAGSEIAKSWEAISSNLSTVNRMILREGFSQMWKDITVYVDSINKSLVDHGELTDKAKSIVLLLKTGWLDVKNIIKIVYDTYVLMTPELKLMVKFVGTIADGWGMIAVTVDTLFKRISTFRKEMTSQETTEHSWLDSLLGATGWGPAVGVGRCFQTEVYKKAKESIVGIFRDPKIKDEAKDSGFQAAKSFFDGFQDEWVKNYEEYQNLKKDVIPEAEDVVPPDMADQTSERLKSNLEAIREFSRDAGSVWDNYTDAFDEDMQKMKRANGNVTDSFVSIYELQKSFNKEADRIDKLYTNIVARTLPKAQREIFLTTAEYARLDAQIDEIADDYGINDIEGIARLHRELAIQMSKDVDMIGNKWKDVLDSIKDALADFFDFTSDGFLNLRDLIKNVGSDISKQLSKSLSEDIMSAATGKDYSTGGLSVQDLFGYGKTAYGMFSGGSEAIPAISQMGSYSTGAANAYGAYGGIVGTGAFDAYAVAGGSPYAAYSGGVSGGASAGSGAGMAAAGYVAILAAIEMLAQSMNEKSGRNIVNLDGKDYAVGLADETGMFNDPAMEWLSGMLHGTGSTHTAGAYGSAAVQAGDWDTLVKSMLAGVAMDPLTSALLGNPVEKAFGLGNIKRAYLGQERSWDYNTVSGAFGLTSEDTYKTERGGYTKFGDSTHNLSKWFMDNLNGIVQTIKPAMSSLSDELAKQYEDLLAGFGNRSGKITQNWFIGAESQEEFDEDFKDIQDRTTDWLQSLTRKSLDMYVEGAKKAFDSADSDKALSILSNTAKEAFTTQMESVFKYIGYGGKSYTKELKEFTEGNAQIVLMVEYISQLNSVYNNATSTLELMLHPLTEWEEKINNLNNQVDGWIVTLAALGASQEKLTDLDNKRLAVIEKINDETAKSELEAILAPILSNINSVRGNFSGMVGNIRQQQSGLSTEDYIMRQINMASAAGDALTVSELADDWYNAAMKAAEEQAKITDTKIEAEQKTAELWRQVSDQASELAGNIADSILGIRYSGLNVSSPNIRSAAAGGDWESILRNAYSTATPDALSQATGFASTYLQEAQSAYKSSTTYTNIYDKVISQLQDLQRFVSSKEYEQKLFDQQRSEQMAINAESTAVDVSSINAQIINWATWAENIGSQQLADIRVTNETLSLMLEKLDRPINVVVEVGDDEFEGYIAAIADEVRVKAIKRDVGKLATR